MIYVTPSSLVPPPAGSGPAWVALQNELQDRAGPSPTETVGKGLKEEILLWGSQAQPLAWPSRVQGVPVAESLPDPGWTLARSLLGLMLPLPSLLYSHSCKLPALHFAAAT